MEIRPVVAELFRANGRTNGQTDMTKLFAVFRTRLRIKGPEDASVTHTRSSVWYINIGHIYSSGAPYRTVIYDWTKAVSPPTPLLLVLNVHASGRSFPETPYGRLQGKIMPWRRLQYHKKANPRPSKMMLRRKLWSLLEIHLKKMVPSRGSILSEKSQATILDSNRHSEIFHNHVSFPSKVRAKAGHTLFLLQSTVIRDNWISAVVLQLVNQATCFDRFIRPSSGLQNNIGTFVYKCTLIDNSIL